MGFVEKEAALAALPTGGRDLKAFWIRKNPPLFEHQVTVQVFTEGMVSLSLWDHYTDEYMPDGPNEAQKAEIRSFALTLFRALVKDTGALLSFVGSYDNKYPPPINQDDVADLMLGALRKDPPQILKPAVKHHDVFWLLVLDKKGLSKALQKYRKKLEKHLNVVEETPDWLILESNSIIPFSLSLGRATLKRT